MAAVLRPRPRVLPRAVVAAAFLVVDGAGAALEDEDDAALEVFFVWAARVAPRLRGAGSGEDSTSSTEWSESCSGSDDSEPWSN